MSSWFSASKVSGVGRERRGISLWRECVNPRWQPTLLLQTGQDRSNLVIGPTCGSWPVNLESFGMHKVRRDCEKSDKSGNQRFTAINPTPCRTSDTKFLREMPENSRAGTQSGKPRSRNRNRNPEKPHGLQQQGNIARGFTVPNCRIGKTAAGIRT